MKHIITAALLVIITMTMSAKAAGNVDVDYQYAATPNSFSDIMVEIDHTAEATFTFKNKGSVAIAYIHYQINIDGIAGEEQRANFSERIAAGSDGSFTITINGDNRPSNKELTLVITRVNGHDNELKSQTATAQLITTNGGLRRNLVVEEFTGANCGFCPRGAAAMEVMREKYGNQFIGIAIHGFNPPDPMFLLPRNGDYAYIFGGSAPSLQLNRRYGEIDPRRGTSTDILLDCEAEMQVPITAGLFVEATFNDDSTQVEATATVVGVAEGGPYTIEYVLVGDSIEGEGKSWWQSNYYATSNQGTYFPDMDKFCKGGEYGESYIKNWVYNDVALVSSYKGGHNTATEVGAIATDETVENKFTLTIPTSNELAPYIRKDQLWVMAILIDENKTTQSGTKIVANGAKARVFGKENQTDNIRPTTTNNDNNNNNTIYDINGRKTENCNLQKGIYIKNKQKIIIR